MSEDRDNRLIHGAGFIFAVVWAIAFYAALGLIVWWVLA